MLNVDTLREIVDYDPSSGLLTWKKWVCSRACKGKPAGRKHHQGYQIITISGKTYLSHRIAWLYTYGEWPRGQIDHMNNKRDDNRIENLRDVSAAGNRQNLKKCLTNNSTGLLGVTFNHGKYTSNIICNGERIYLGRFALAEEAHAAYMAAKQKHHPYWSPS